jgi:hypothetical protein
MKRDVLRKSSVGVIFTKRSVSESAAGSNEAYGVDGAFGFYDNLTLNTYWAQTKTDGQSGDEGSYRAQLDYAGDRYGIQLEHLRVGANFKPEVGFVRRPDMRRHFGQFRFSPRPRKSRVVRKYYWIGALDYVENGAGRVDTRIGSGTFQSEFQNGDRFNLGYSRNYDFLPLALPLTTTVVVPVGGYDYASVQAGYTYAPTRKIASGALAVEQGGFYGGRKTTVTVSQGRLAFPPHLSVEPSYSINRVDIPQGAFTTHLIGSRINVTMTPLMFAGALVQYNSTSHAVSANVRIRWEYRPGSELFLVLNEQRDTLTRGFPTLGNRAFIVKVNRLFQF